MSKPCSVMACPRPAIARNWCGTHWARWRKTGSPTGTKPRRPRRVTRVVLRGGYVAVFRPDHPMADQLGWVREHRMVAFDHGLLTGRDDPRQVHHRNHDPADNAIGNLEVLSEAEHRKRHRHKGSRVSDKQLIELHAEGLTTTAIGAKLNYDPAAVWRRLHGLGLEAHGYQRGWDPDEAVRLARSGGRPAWIAELLGTTEGAVRGVLKKHNATGPAGRPRAGEREQWFAEIGARR